MMPQVTINYPAVLVAAVLAMVAGYLWYGPIFGKEWGHLTGMTKEKMDKMKPQMPRIYGINALLLLLEAFVLAHVIGFTDGYTLSLGMQAGFWVWLGFVATVLCTTKYLFGGRSFKEYAIDAGYQLVVLLLMGAVLGVWQ